MNFEPIEAWGKLPEGWRYVECAGVAVDGKDNVFVFTRGEHPVIVFDRDGRFLRSWGEGLVRRAHAVTIDADEMVWLTDDLHHTVRKFTPDGKLLLTIGDPDKPSELQGGKPFNRPTHVAICPKTGFLFISDGYGNSRVHKYAPDGRHVMSWGEPGTDPGQFNLPHNLATDAEGLVYVADRENHRVQIFDGQGRYQGQWNHLHRPCGLFADRGDNDHFYIGELGAGLAVSEKTPPRDRARQQGGARLPVRRAVSWREAGGVRRAAQRGHRLARRPLRGRGVVYQPRPPRDAPARDPVLAEVQAPRVGERRRLQDAHVPRPRRRSARCRDSGDRAARLRQWEESAGRPGHDLARLEVFQRPLQLEGLPRRPEGTTAAEQRALDRRRLQVAHGQLSGDVDPAGVVQRRPGQDLVEVGGDDAAVRRSWRPLEAQGNDDRGEYLAAGAEAPDAQADVVVGTAPEAFVEPRAGTGEAQLFEPGEHLLEGRGNG